jgi:hypothetical protein
VKQMEEKKEVIAGEEGLGRMVAVCICTPYF